MKKKGFTATPDEFIESFSNKELTFSEVKVYLYLLKWKNYSKDKYTTAARTTIMKHTGLSENSVSQAILGLVEKGWIKDIIHQKDVGKREGKNRYLVNDKPEQNTELLIRERTRRAVKRVNGNKREENRDSKGRFDTSKSEANIDTSNSPANPYLKNTSSITYSNSDTNKKENQEQQVSSLSANAAPPPALEENNSTLESRKEDSPRKRSKKEKVIVTINDSIHEARRLKELEKQKELESGIVIKVPSSEGL